MVDTGASETKITLGIVYPHNSWQPLGEERPYGHLQKSKEAFNESRKVTNDMNVNYT